MALHRRAQRSPAAPAAARLRWGNPCRPGVALGTDPPAVAERAMLAAGVPFLHARLLPMVLVQRGEPRTNRYG